MVSHNKEEWLVAYIYRASKLDASLTISYNSSFSIIALMLFTVLLFFYYK